MYSDLLRLRVDYINQLNNQLFQRVNYFLVGIAFLVTAFVALANVRNFECGSQHFFLITLICTTGFMISIFFAVMNFIDSNRYKRFAQKVECDLYKGYVKWTQSLWNDETVAEDKLHVPHTWLIPLGFTVFWELAWITSIKCIRHGMTFSPIDVLALSIIAGIGTIGTICILCHGYRETYNKCYRRWFLLIAIVLLMIFVILTCLPCG